MRIHAISYFIMREIWTKMYALPRKSYFEINLDRAKVNVVCPAKDIFIQSLCTTEILKKLEIYRIDLRRAFTILKGEDL